MSEVTFERIIRVHVKVATSDPSRTMSAEERSMRQPRILVVGCGGTGGWVIPHLARLIKSLNVGSLVIADKDVVEPKNLGRQNFVQADLGECKAIALAKRYSRAFGIPIRAIPGFLEDVRGLMKQAPQIVVGCVDKHAARRTMAEYFAQQYESVWIDAGNESVAGMRTSASMACWRVDPRAKASARSSGGWPSDWRAALTSACSRRARRPRAADAQTVRR